VRWRIHRLFLSHLCHPGNFQWNANYPTAAIFEKDIAANHLWVAHHLGQTVGFAALTMDQGPDYAKVV
jgi:hypothetical protein